MLPRQPLPDLNKTLDRLNSNSDVIIPVGHCVDFCRWLSVAEILLDADDFEMSKDVIEEFRVSNGPKIQDYLVEK